MGNSASFSILEAINSIQRTVHIPKIGLGDIVEILILAFLFYFIVKNLQGTRAWVLLKGVVVLFGVYLVAYLLGFDVIVVIFQNLVLFFGIAVIVIIQPDIRKMIESIGRREINITFKTILDALLKRDDKHTEVVKRVSDKTVQELIKGCALMGKAKTGALIVIEGDIPLNDIIDSGIKIDAEVTSQLLINIFEKNTPLHDGAVIIKNDRVAAATCYLPLSNNNKINKDLGTRHRAGIGITEQTDAAVLIVSEETGAISFARSGNLYHNIDREKLAELLKKVQAPKRVERKQEHIVRRNLPHKIACLIGAILIWSIVITGVNPIESRVISSVPIEIINAEAITDTGKTYSVTSGGTVNVTVKDRKDVLDMLEPSDVSVVADLSKLSITNSVELEARIPSLPDCEVSLSTQTMQVAIEDVVSTEVNISVESENSNNPNYYLADVELNNSTIVVTGAKSIIDTIGSVTVEIDGSDIDEAASNPNNELSIRPKVYDKNGSQIDSSSVTLSQPEVIAHLTVYGTKTVPVVINTEISNFVLKSIIKNINYNISEITIAAPDDVLNQYDSVNITIPLDIALSEVRGNQFIRTIDLAEYMPSELNLVNASETLNIELEFVDFYNNSLTFNESSIEIRNGDSDKHYTISPKEFNISLIGVDQAISSATVASIKPYIDASSLVDGENTVNVLFDTLGSYIFGDVSVIVTVTNKG